MGACVIQYGHRKNPGDLWEAQEMRHLAESRMFHGGSKLYWGTVGGAVRLMEVSEQL